MFILIKAFRIIKNESFLFYNLVKLYFGKTVPLLAQTQRNSSKYFISQKYWLDLFN